MTHWLTLIPYLPAWSGWPTISRLAEGTPTW